MSENAPGSLNPYELNARYKTFPDFANWNTTKINLARWSRYAGDLAAASQVTSEQLDRAREIVKRVTAINTGAIENLYEASRGFTQTVAWETVLWQASSERLQGKKVTALIEAQMNAYDYVLDLATREARMNEGAIRTLHEVVCANQETYQVQTPHGPQNRQLPKGTYKVHDNHVQTRLGEYHVYAPVESVGPEMTRLVDELNSEAFLNAHPVLQAAYAHYAFVVIHPFADGNGRVARALGSVFTYRSQSVPLLILSEKKQEYLDALETADKGTFAPFVEFILDSTLDAMKMVEDSLIAALSSNSDSLLASFESMTKTESGYTHVQIDEAANNLINSFLKELKEVVASIQPRAANLNITTAQGFLVSQNRVAIRENYRFSQQGGTPTTARLNIRTDGLLQDIDISTETYATVPANSGINDDMIISIKGNKDLAARELFSARISDVLPEISMALQLRMKIVAEGLLNSTIEKLYDKARAANDK